MAKTAMNRHHHYRMMRKRLKTPLWAWAKDNPKFRNMAARHSWICSCYACRCSELEHRKEMERRAMTIAENEAAWR